MVKIRLARGGAKKRPFYHIVVADARSPRDGRYIKRLGYFDPLVDEDQGVHLDVEEMNKWISRGAQMTDRVKSIFKRYKKRIQSNELE